MVFQVKTTLETILNHLKKAGLYPHAQIGEYKQPVSTAPKKFAVALWMTSMSVVAVYANGGTKELHVVTLRVYCDMLAEPQAEIETEMAAAVSKTCSDLIGEYDLGATVRNIDVGGEAGVPLSVAWGYTTIGTTMYRVADLTVPLIVDDSATAAA